MTDPPLRDNEVIDLLRHVDGGRSTLDLDALLARSKRSVRRRRVGALAATSAAAVAAVVAVGVVLGPSLGRPDSPPALPAASTTASAPPSAASARSSGTSPATSAPDTSLTGRLLGVLGSGWQPDSRSPDEATIRGVVRVTPGSAAAGGLPSGYDAVVRLTAFTPAVFDVSRVCRASSEKGTVTSACTTVTTADGTTLQRQLAEASGSSQGTFSSTRLIAVRTDGTVVVADLLAADTVGAAGVAVTPSATDRAAAAQWCSTQLDRLETAVTTIDVPPSS